MPDNSALKIIVRRRVGVKAVDQQGAHALRNSQLFTAVAFFEFVYLSGSINDFLFASEKRMTQWAHIDMHWFGTIGRACGKSIPTAACDCNVLVAWMYVWFHYWVVIC